MDVLPKILLELRGDAEVAALVGDRVRGFEPGPDDAAWEGLANGQRRYRHAFVVVVRLSSPRDQRLPIQRPRLAVRNYGRTLVEAAELRWATSHALHNIGPRIHPNGLGIYNTLEDGGGDQGRDPDTGQPVETFIVQALATTQVVTV